MKLVVTIVMGIKMYDEKEIEFMHREIRWFLKTPHFEVGTVIEVSQYIPLNEGECFNSGLYPVGNVLHIRENYVDLQTMHLNHNKKSLFGVVRPTYYYIDKDGAEKELKFSNE